LYEGTRVTQNVKTPRAPSATTRYLTAVFGLLLAAWLLAACSTDDTKQPGSGGCSGSACAVAGSGRFSPCKLESECDEAHGFHCVDDECSYECQSHADCVEVGHCAPHDFDGVQRNFCVHDDPAPVVGELYTSCPNGTECSDPSLCLGAGVGDLDAYCTIDCASDRDCATGYTCGSLVRPPCENACGVRGQPSEPRCVPADQIGDDQAFRCTPSGVERRVCRQREFCSPCDSDADCLALPNQVCAKDASGEKICTRLCEPGTHSCPWGNAAECATFDTELGQPTCSHRFGSCHGEGKACEPCRTNDDCPGGACLSSQFTGERWCVNFDTTCECKNPVGASGVCSNAGCPSSPSGLPLQCIGASDSPLANICYAANSGSDTLLGSSPQTGCWDPL
jgi:hypothetical protein